jgi:hypothetical protein
VVVGAGVGGGVGQLAHSCTLPTSTTGPAAAPALLAYHGWHARLVGIVEHIGHGKGWHDAKVLPFWNLVHCHRRS